MSCPYTKPFADYYDLRTENLVQNAGQEIEFLKFAFGNFARVRVSKILDVGCGTGRHSIPLMQEEYQVTGLDMSQNMLNVLKKKAETANLEPHIFRKDMREMDFASEFDAIICIDDVLGSSLPERK